VATAAAVPRHAASATIAVQADTPLLLSKSSISREIGAASAKASFMCAARDQPVFGTVTRRARLLAVSIKLCTKDRRD
jgi:hypothetical protein